MARALEASGYDFAVAHAVLAECHDDMAEAALLLVERLGVRPVRARARARACLRSCRRPRALPFL